MKRPLVEQFWAPRDAIWSPWVKPFLFAHIGENEEPEAPLSLPSWIEPRIIKPLLKYLEMAPRAEPLEHPYRSSSRLHRFQEVALILDLPGADGALAGVALTQHGFRPIPLYNAIPFIDRFIKHAIDLDEVMNVLINRAKDLEGLPNNAPPTFLLDSRRLGNSEPEVGTWDNRSRCYPSDFPSPQILEEAGVRRIVLVHNSDRPALDLLPMLRLWQQQGLEILLQRARQDGPVEVSNWGRPSWFRRINEFLDGLTLPSMAPERDGTFGHIVPESPEPDYPD